MKITTKMSRATAQIESMFKALNEQLFDSQLPTPILYFYDQHQSHTSAEERWDSHGEPCYEIGLSINKIALPIESLAAELLHEMIHLYCRENGIKDTSRGGTYHNRQFKEVAENYGLICEKDERRGWTTAPSDELIELVADYAWHKIRNFEVIVHLSNTTSLPFQLAIYINKVSHMKIK